MNLASNKHPFFIDIFFSFVLFVLIFFVGFIIHTFVKINPSFYQIEFAPAVSIACGKGFTNYNLLKIPELDDFLSLKTDTFTDANLLKKNVSLEPDPFQIVHYYLISLVGIFWKIFGVSWSKLAGLTSFMYGLSAVLTYLIFRMFFSRLLRAYP